MGFALIAAPVLVLIDTALVPGPLLVAGLTLTILMAFRERQSVDVRGVRWALAGCLVGCALAIPVIRTLSPMGFAVLFSALLLLAVAFTAAGLHVRPSPRVNLVGGLASGFMGTISTVGGPPMALIYQRATGPTLRSTLAVYFTFAGFLSVAALYVAGKLGTKEVILGSYLAPGLLLGYAMSSYTKKFIDQKLLRPIVLTLATAAAVAVVLKALI
jgi:uncharacterized membrane protein YfcA